VSQSTDSASKASSNNLNRQVAQYSLAAAVAGVSMLALVQPTAGEVVVTRKTIPIPLAPRTVPEPVTISIANNGIENFNFYLNSSVTSVGLRELVVVSVDPGQNGAHNQVIAGGSFYGKALALERGVKIGPAAVPSASFGSFGALVEGTNSNTGSFYSRGFWAGNLKNRYLGVRFLINGKFHYGWIRLTVTTNVKLRKPTLSATITGYAYETVPDKPILAGTTGIAASAEVQVPEKNKNQVGPSLGMLAAGVEGLTVWRREEPSARQ
jgi:hypothetical protein